MIRDSPGVITDRPDIWPVCSPMSRSLAAWSLQGGKRQGILCLAARLRQVSDLCFSSQHFSSYPASSRSDVPSLCPRWRHPSAAGAASEASLSPVGTMTPSAWSREAWGSDPDRGNPELPMGGQRCALPMWSLSRSTTWWSDPVGQVNVSGEMASEPAALRESNAVRLSDLVLLTEEVDGSVRPLSCARPTTARSASSPACRGTWNRIGDCLRADVRRPRRRRRLNWTGPVAPPGAHLHMSTEGHRARPPPRSGISDRPRGGVPAQHGSPAPGIEECRIKEII